RDSRDPFRAGDDRARELATRRVVAGRIPRIRARHAEGDDATRGERGRIADPLGRGRGLSFRARSLRYRGWNRSERESRMPKLLEGKVAIVTGGSQGLGQAIAGALGIDGANVLLVARRPEELEMAAAQVRKHG